MFPIIFVVLMNNILSQKLTYVIVILYFLY